jgi:hypothetical protein
MTFPEIPTLIRHEHGGVIGDDDDGGLTILPVPPTLRYSSRPRGLWWLDVVPEAIEGYYALRVSHTSSPGMYLIPPIHLGNNPLVQMTVVRLVRRYMVSLPEDFDPDTFVERMPQSRSEVTEDPELALALCRLAGYRDDDARIIVEFLSAPIEA